MDKGLQEQVSKQLGRLMMRLIGKPHACDLPVWINCSWAWVRWFSNKDCGVRRRVLERLDKIIERADPAKDAQLRAFSQKRRERTSVIGWSDQSSIRESRERVTS